MKNIMLLIALLVVLAINYANCLTCISNVLGTTATTGTATCGVGVQACYKVSTAFTATATGTTGVSYGLTATTSQAFVVNDRGCLPVLAAGAIAGSAVAGVAQATTVQMTLGSAASGATTAGLLNDLFALQSNLCNVYGSCCYSNNCSPSPATKTVFSLVNLVFTLVFSLISYVAIF